MAEEATRSSRAADLVKNHALGTLIVGIVPLPFVDVSLSTAIQVKMLKALAGLYGVEFARERIRSLIAAVAGSGTSALVSANLTSALRKVWPPTRLIGAASMSSSACASTYAIGKVFIQHFESGGTFLTFDPERVRDYYAEQLEKGREQAKSFAGVRP